VSEKFHNLMSRLLRSALTLVSLMLIVAGGAVVVSLISGNSAAATLAGSTAGVCTAAALLALLPMGMVRDAGAAPSACMLSMLTRLFITALGVGGLAMIGNFDRTALGLWTAGWYVLLLVVEVIMFVALLREIDQRQPAGKEAAAW
jgi:hypothetical protein